MLKTYCKRFCFLVLTLFTVSIYANVEPENFSSMPYFCKTGAVKKGSISVEAEQCGINSSNSMNCEDVDYSDGSSYDSLAAVSNNRLLIDNNSRIKGDGTYLLSASDNIYFYDSYGGYRGTDKSNHEGNAYFTYNVSDVYNYGSGYGWVWVMKDLSDQPICSKKEVIFQGSPSLSGSRTLNGNEVRFNFNWRIDSLSKAAMNSATKPIVFLTLTSDSYGNSNTGSIELTGLSGSNTISVEVPNGGGIQVAAEIYDGTYRKKLELSPVRVQGEEIPPCPRCNKN